MSVATQNPHTPIVVYYRTSSTRGEFAQAAVAQQHEAVEAFLRPGGYQVIGEYTEDLEMNGYPELGKAVGRCIRSDATLVIASDASLDPHDPYADPLTAVPPVDTITLIKRPDLGPPPARSTPLTQIVLPEDDAQPDLYLLGLQSQSRGCSIDLYLCNGAREPLVDARWQMSGWATMDDEVVTIGNGPSQIGEIPAGVGVFLETYDLMFDGDFVISYKVGTRSKTDREWKEHCFAIGKAQAHLGVYYPRR